MSAAAGRIYSFDLIKDGLFKKSLQSVYCIPSYGSALICPIPPEPVADGPADDAPRMQVQDHSQIQPPLAGPDVADVAGPLLVGSFAAVGP